jgi:transcriptional regulator with XRE-family HTH domain
VSEVPIHETPGERVRMLRKRAGMTQAELGNLVGRDQSWISRIEKGEYELDSVSQLNELARALRAHPNELTGRPLHDPAAPARRGHDAATDLLRHLRRLDLAPERSEHRPLEQLAEELAALTRLRGQAKYVQLGIQAVDLVTELHAATTDPGQARREAAFRLLAHTCKEIHSLGHGLGYPDLVVLAAWRVRWAAEHCDDPRMLAMADYLAARDAWTTADWADAMALIDRALAIVEQAPDPSGVGALSLTGALHLRAAITAARAGNAHEAYHRLDQAGDAAHGAGACDPYLTWFSAGNVGLHRVAVAVEIGDGVEAVRRSRGLIVPADIPPSRLAHHYLDTSRGFAWIGDPERSLAALERADSLAPELVRNHPMAQAVMRGLLRAERRSIRGRMHRMATRLQVA